VTDKQPKVRSGPEIYSTLPEESIMGHKYAVRVVTRAADGGIRSRDYLTTELLQEIHSQIGIDDCSIDLSLRGLPVFRELIGPMPEGTNVARYESRDVFETLTKEWASAKTLPRRSRSRREIRGLTRRGICSFSSVAKRYVPFCASRKTPHCRPSAGIATLDSAMACGKCPALDSNQQPID
jgi:hypothetical protein